jgi:hypothetical protein
MFFARLHRQGLGLIVRRHSLSMLDSAHRGFGADSAARTRLVWLRPSSEQRLWRPLPGRDVLVTCHWHGYLSLFSKGLRIGWLLATVPVAMTCTIWQITYQLAASGLLRAQALWLAEAWPCCPSGIRHLRQGWYRAVLRLQRQPWRGGSPILTCLRMPCSMSFCYNRRRLGPGIAMKGSQGHEGSIGSVVKVSATVGDR